MATLRNVTLVAVTMLSPVEAFLYERTLIATSPFSDENEEAMVELYQAEKTRLGLDVANDYYTIGELEDADDSSDLPTMILESVAGRQYYR